MPRVTIHLRKKTALILMTSRFDRLVNGDTRSDADLVYFRELQQALTRATVSVATKALKARPRKIATAHERSTKRDETAAIRQACVERSGHMCEAGCGRPIHPASSSMDHFFGRARIHQRISNCWLICFQCDRAKTENKPSASYWLGRFIEHAERHGYLAEAARAKSRREAISEVQQAGTISRGERP